MNLLDANDQPGQYPPSWYAATTQFLPPFPSFDGTDNTDICIIGAGYTGLSAALHLANQGCAVTLLEAQRVGFGASGRNGGQLGSGQRLDQETLLRWLGPQSADALWDLAEEAIDCSKSLIKQPSLGFQTQTGKTFIVVQRFYKNAMAMIKSRCSMKRQAKRSALLRCIKAGFWITEARICILCAMFWDWQKQPQPRAFASMKIPASSI